MTLAALLFVLNAAPAQEERLDHRGALGLIFAVSPQNKVANDIFEVGWRLGLDVGGTMNVGWGSNEVVFAARATFGAPHVGSPAYGTSACLSPTTLPPQACVADDHRLHEVETSLYTGFRGYFGDRWKTFFDLDVAVHFTPYLEAGPRIGVGLQYELGSLAGIYAQLCGNLGLGEVLQFKGELVIGVQLRSYLME